MGSEKADRWLEQGLEGNAMLLFGCIMGAQLSIQRADQGAYLRRFRQSSLDPDCCHRSLQPKG
jgi:hypothetical protein